LNERAAIIAERLQQTAADLSIPMLAVLPELMEGGGQEPSLWSDRLFSGDVIMVLRPGGERSRQPAQPNQPVTLHVVKNRRGEKAQLAFNFHAAFSKFDPA
jgi:hypothetical protein